MKPSLILISVGAAPGEEGERGNRGTEKHWHCASTKLHGAHTCIQVEVYYTQRVLPLLSNRAEGIYIRQPRAPAEEGLCGVLLLPRLLSEDPAYIFVRHCDHRVFNNFMLSFELLNLLSLPEAELLPSGSLRLFVFLKAASLQTLIEATFSVRKHRDYYEM